MTKGIVTPIRSPENMEELTTSNRTNLTHAINEVAGNVADNIAASALAEKSVHIDIGPAGPIAIPALPAGAKVIGVQAHVTSAYSVGSKIYVGDHSGEGGTLADNAICDGTGITATAAGDYVAAVYQQPSGNLSVTIHGGDGLTGAATVFVKYIDA